MKKVILFLVCIISSCMIPSMYAKVENVMIGTYKASNAPIVQPGFVVSMSNWSSNVGEYLPLWTEIYLRGEPAVENFHILSRSDVLLVTVAIKEEFRNNIDLEEFRIAFCQSVGLMVAM